MSKILLALAILFFSSCTTEQIKQTQSNCYILSSFTEFHRCSENIVKNSYEYKFSFERDIIDQYFAYGEVLSQQVERKTLNNAEAFKSWGDQLVKDTLRAEARGKEAQELVVLTGSLALIAFNIYKAKAPSPSVSNTQVQTSVTPNISRATTAVANYTPNSQIAACRVGLIINRVQGTVNNLMRTWC
jgi:hypothetical protein